MDWLQYCKPALVRALNILKWFLVQSDIEPKSMTIACELHALLGTMPGHEHHHAFSLSRSQLHPFTWPAWHQFTSSSGELHFQTGPRTYDLCRYHSSPHRAAGVLCSNGAAYPACACSACCPAPGPSAKPRGMPEGLATPAHALLFASCKRQ